MGSEYDARDDSEAASVRCGEERERELRAILKFSSQKTMDSSLDLCKNFLHRKKLTIPIYVANSNTVHALTNRQEKAHVTALRLVILASRHLCLHTKFADH